MNKNSVNITNLKSSPVGNLRGFGLLLFLFVFAFSSCEEDRHLDWRYINVQWYEQERARLCEETGEKFWAETESGLLYRVINEGIGDDDYRGRPGNRSWVEIAYTGTFFNNAQFDSSTGMTNYLAGFVPGFQEALRMMKKNAIYEVILPYKIAYGDNDGGSIPPYSALQFKIELMNFGTE